MIENIVKILPYAKGETEHIRIAQGKYELQTNFKGIINQIKKDVQCRKK